MLKINQTLAKCRALLPNEEYDRRLIPSFCFLRECKGGYELEAYDHITGAIIGSAVILGEFDGPKDVFEYIEVTTVTHIIPCYRIKVYGDLLGMTSNSHTNLKQFYQFKAIELK